jgi:ribosomal protein S18 acetylase RimI-like enzyme
LIKKLNIADKCIAEGILNLQRDSYKIEANYIGSDEIPPLKESLSELMESGEEFYGYFDKDELVGVISYKLNSVQIDIYRVMVHPLHFRKGIAENLVRFIENIHCSAKEAIVSTGAKNLPAVKLYEKLGFEKVDEVEVGDGIMIAHFRKELVILEGGR